MSFELTGTIHEIFQTNQKSERFRTREFIIETTNQIGDRNITNYVKFQATGDKCDTLNTYRVGSKVTVSFNIRGNKWENAGKVSYFTNLEAWKIQGEAISHNAPQSKAEQEWSSDVPF